MTHRLTAKDMPPSSRIERRKPEAHLDKMEERPTGRNESVGLLNTIDKSLDDMRAIITCRVCVRPLYEPFTIECGHTFCYTCLVSWFEKNTANKTCPDCRAKITRTPAPAYLVCSLLYTITRLSELMCETDSGDNPTLLKQGGATACGRDDPGASRSSKRGGEGSRR